MVIPFDEVRYTKFSDNVVVATVQGTLPSMWDNKREFILTPHVVSVVEVVKGPPLPKEVVVYSEGGQVGNDVMVFSDPVRLQPGWQVVLFLFRSPQGGPLRDEFKVVGSYEGFFRLKDGLAYHDPRRAPQPLGQLVANIRAAERGEFFPTPTPTPPPKPPDVDLPSGGKVPPGPPVLIDPSKPTPTPDPRWLPKP